jgi:hypothetical protein
MTVEFHLSRRGNATVVVSYDFAFLTQFRSSFRLPAGARGDCCISSVFIVVIKLYVTCNILNEDCQESDLCILTSEL